MKRFYKTVDVREDEDGFQVTLDGKPIRTPAKKPLRLPSEALADAIRQEWASQSETIDPASMPLMRLAATAIDRVADAMESVAEEIAKYAETDLLCYRAEAPGDLARRQAAMWQPLLDWVSLRFDAPLRISTGIMPTEQSADSLRALAAALPRDDVFALTALADLTGVCGSLVLALALWHGRIEAEDAAEAALLDESFQAERWGEDAEAAKRRHQIRADIDAATRFLKTLAPRENLIIQS